jgi:glycine betaine/proline transport system substrate-binding protein
MADIGIQYDSVARGKLDLMLMAWLPKTHEKYWQKVSDRVLDLGTMYSGRIGWVVPDYVPKQRISSIGDLSDPKVANGFNNTVQGIDPGSGLMQASEKALNIYDLSDLKLISASGAAMTAVLDRAINDDQWVVVTGWTPHWMFARYKLRFLKDPKSAFGGQEGIHAIARLGLDKDHPKVVAFLTRFKLSDGELDAMLLDAQNTSTEKAVNNYIANNKKQIDYWMNGTIKEPKDRKAKP